MFPYVVGTAALAIIIVELYRTPDQEFGTASPWFRVLRPLPFIIVAAISIIVAGRAPRGRHSFSIDLSLAREDLARSMTKVPHLRSIAVIFLLAVIAFGVNRLLIAFGATMLVGVGWELAEATVIGHYGRLADLLPNLVSGLVSLALIAGLRWLVLHRATQRSASEQAG
ncbi:MAG TPA: hypothetical protein VF980_17630 [Thermoanaerobaculia bacterium]